MKALSFAAVLVCSGLVIALVSSAFADNQGAKESAGPTAKPLSVQTDVKLTRKLPGGKAEVIAAPRVRAYVGQPASIEVTLPNGETLTVHVKAMPVDVDHAAPVKPDKN